MLMGLLLPAAADETSSGCFEIPLPILFYGVQNACYFVAIPEVQIQTLAIVVVVRGGWCTIVISDGKKAITSVA